MGNNVTIAFNHPFDKSQEIVIYPEIKKRQRPSQVESDDVSEEMHGASSSAQDRSLLQSMGNSSQISGKQMVDKIADENKPSSKWWKRIVKKNNIDAMHKERENTTIDKPIDQPGPSGNQQSYGKISVLKCPNNIRQNKVQPTSKKQVSKNAPLPSCRLITHSTINKMKLNPNLPSSSRQTSNNFSYNLPSSRQRKDVNTGKQTRDSVRKPPLPSNQNRREPPKHVPGPPIKTRKDTVKNQQHLPLPSQQNTSKYRRGPLNPSSHQAQVPPKGLNIRKANQDPPPLPSNQNSRTPGKKPPSQFNFRPSLWARELEPRIIRVPDSRTSIPGTSLEKEDRYNRVKTWILSVQKHYRMND